MLKSKHGEPNLACMRTMCNIAQEVKMQLQMRCLVCGAIGCPGDPSGLHELWGVPVSLDFGTSFAVKTYLLQWKRSTRRVRSVPRAPL